MGALIRSLWKPLATIGSGVVAVVRPATATMVPWKEAGVARNVARTSKGRGSVGASLVGVAVLLVSIMAAPVALSAQVEDECWACGRAKCQVGGEYRKCTPSDEGSAECKQTLPSKRYACGRCNDRGELCEEGFVSATEVDEALDAFAHGRMLPSNGAFFIGVRGDEIVLRQKCGGTLLARLALSNMGIQSRMVLAGG